MVQLPADKALMLEEQLPYLGKLGFDVEAFGPNAYKIRAIPAIIQKGDPQLALTALVEAFEEDETPLQKEIEARIGRDDLLTNIMIYWVTETIGSSVRRYYLDTHTASGPWERTPVPAAVAHPPRDAPLPREWAERRVNLVRFTDLSRGGHFAAWEEPELYAEDLRAFVGELRNL